MIITPHRGEYFLSMLKLRCTNQSETSFEKHWRSKCAFLLADLKGTQSQCYPKMWRQKLSLKLKENTGTVKKNICTLKPTTLPNHKLFWYNKF